MNKILILLITILFGVNVFGQSAENSELIKLGKAYKDYMFRNTPEKEYLKKFAKEYPISLQQEANFIKQTISSGNKLLDKEFLSIPDQTVLKNIYIIREVNLILRKESEITPNELVDSLKLVEIPRYELIDNYYGMLFTGVGNKNQPFDFSKNDFNLDEYRLKDETEKGIFFLKCMNLCGTNIWGFMNVVNPPNTSKALSYIKKYPKFNGKLYYQFSDLYFTDFEMVIIEDEGMQSYKSYYLDKYYDTLLSHLICLNKEGGTEDEIRDLLLGSIMKDEELYKYTKHKEILESIFQKKEKK
ncbi:MAG: hypothetical protein R2828_18260 [Saprospiraceae bacterium]